MNDLQVPTSKTTEETYAARVAACLRTGLSSREAVVFASRHGRLYAATDRDQTGLEWRWPGPAPYTFSAECVRLISLSHPAADEQELQAFVGMVFAARLETRGEARTGPAVVVDKNARFKRPKV